MSTTVNHELVAAEFVAVEPVESARERRTPNFDRLAGVYRWMELVTFGPLLTRCREAFLADVISARRAVVLGDGDGRFTAELLRVNPQVQIEAVDASAAMLEALKRRAGANADRVSAYCADARDWRPAEAPVDLVATHFFLDCLTTEEIRALAKRVSGAMSPSAVWIVSEFAIPESWFGRWVAQHLVWLLYRAFGLLTGLEIRGLPEHRAALQGAGFTLAERRRWLRGLLVSEMWVIGRPHGKCVACEA
jgi:ubiquinone/menaquinone biosynthesis C-methylase UbiE